MGHSPITKPNTVESSQVGYAAKPSPPCWSRVFLASAHINKLMIIVKEKTTHTVHTTKNRRVS